MEATKGGIAKRRQEEGPERCSLYSITRYFFFFFRTAATPHLFTADKREDKHKEHKEPSRRPDPDKKPGEDGDKDKKKLSDGASSSPCLCLSVSFCCTCPETCIRLCLYLAVLLPEPSSLFLCASVSLHTTERSVQRIGRFCTSC